MVLANIVVASVNVDNVNLRISNINEKSTGHGGSSGTWVERNNSISGAVCLQFLYQHVKNYNNKEYQCHEIENRVYQLSFYIKAYQ